MNPEQRAEKIARHLNLDPKARWVTHYLPDVTAEIRDAISEAVITALEVNTASWKKTCEAAVDEAIGCLVTEGACRARIQAAVEEAERNMLMTSIDRGAEIGAEAYEEAAKIADDFGWDLPMYEKKCCNEASDDSACEVCKQVAHAIRAKAKELNSEK